MSSNHKWIWIVSGYARRCKKCGFTQYFSEKLKKSKDIQYLQGGFPTSPIKSKNDVPPCISDVQFIVKEGSEGKQS